MKRVIVISKSLSLEELEKRTKFVFKTGEEFNLEHFILLLEQMYDNFLKSNQHK